MPANKREVMRAFYQPCFCLATSSFKGRKVTIVTRILSSHNLPTDRAKELFKPSKKAESLLASILKFGHFWV